MPDHVHRFEPATLIPFAGGTQTAWLPTRSVTPEVSTPHAWMCFFEDCYEQGYEVR